MRMEFRDAELDRLHEERDNLHIRISLLQKEPDPRLASLTAARAQLKVIEQDIEDHRRPASLP
jgi:hypothetical protein